MDIWAAKLPLKVEFLTADFLPVGHTDMNLIYNEDFRALVNEYLQEGAFFTLIAGNAEIARQHRGRLEFVVDCPTAVR